MFASLRHDIDKCFGDSVMTAFQNSSNWKTNLSPIKVLYKLKCIARFNEIRCMISISQSCMFMFLRMA